MGRGCIAIGSALSADRLNRLKRVLNPEDIGYNKAKMFIETLFKDPTYFFVVVGVVIVSVSLHEFAHAAAATWQGDDTAKKAGFLTFNPWVQMGLQSLIFLLLIGICWGQTPVNPSRFRHGRLGESLVSFAGPLMNLILMSVSVMMVILVDIDVFAVIFGVAALYNAVLFLFNMIPLPPLDGFGVLEPLLPFLRPYRKVLMTYGLMVLIVIVFAFRGGDYLFLLARQMVGWMYRLFS